MRVFRNPDNITIERPVATMGIFDGVHLAHQSIIKQLIATAKNLLGESTIVTLWPHPRIFLNHNRDPIKLLNTLDEKIERLDNAGIGNLIIIPFDEELAAMSSEQFIIEILLKKIGIIHLVVGYNHQFGRNREGNYEQLQELSGQLGFGLSKLPPVIIKDTRISSSLIRRLIMEGKMEYANKYLGYTYYITGKVTEGSRKGRDIGFPTANIEINDNDKLLPPKGVYAVYIDTSETCYKGMMNIGCRPTLNEDCMQHTLEVNLFDFSGNLYNKELRISFIKKIREEKKFTGIEELRKQITADKQLINKILDSVKMNR